MNAAHLRKQLKDAEAFLEECEGTCSAELLGQVHTYVKRRELACASEELAALEKRARWVFTKGFDDDGSVVFTYVNEAFARELGASPAEVVGKTDWDFNKNEREVQHFLEVDHALLSGDKRVVVEDETFTTREKTYLLRTTKECISVGGRRQVLGVANLIPTSEVEDPPGCNVPAILDSFAHNIVIKSTEGRVMLCNSHFALSHGYSPEAMIGQLEHDRWPSETAAKFVEDDQQVLDSGEEYGPFDEHLTRSDGTRISLLTWKIPLFDIGRTGRVIGLVCICEMVSHQGANGVVKVRDRSACLSSLSTTRDVIQAMAQLIVRHVWPVQFVQSGTTNSGMAQ